MIEKTTRSLVFETNNFKVCVAVVSVVSRAYYYFLPY